MLYESIFKALQKHEVRYLVVGGVAVTLHGIIRSTLDLDIVLDLSEDNLKKFLAAMKEAGYVPRLPVAPEDFLSPEKRREWVNEKNLKAFTFWNKKGIFDHLDVLLCYPVETSRLFERRKPYEIEGLTIFAASVDDLISMKKDTGRDKDKLDVGMLTELKEEQDEQKS